MDPQEGGAGTWTAIEMQVFPDPKCDIQALPWCITALFCIAHSIGTYMLRGITRAEGQESAHALLFAVAEYMSFEE